MLSWLISQWIRQTAQEKLVEAVEGRLGRRSETEENSSDEPRTDGPEEKKPREPVEIALIFALDAEAGGTVDLLKDSETIAGQGLTEHLGRFADREVVVVETGVGRDAARKAVEEVLRIRRPRWVVSTGFAGGLIPQLRRRHILMPDEIVDAAGRTLEIGLGMDREHVEQTKGLHTGRLVTIDKLAETVAQKEALAAAHQAVAVDMESFAVAETCLGRKVRFLSVRVISDAVDDELPPEVATLLNQKTMAGQWGAAAAAIFSRPAALGDLLQLKEDAIAASDRLARFLQGVVAQLD